MYFYYGLAGLAIREAYVRSSSRQRYQLYYSLAGLLKEKHIFGVNVLT